MLKENYKAWAVNINSFPSHEPVEKQIAFLLNFAILAPSGHNSQPWKVKINSNVLSVFINPEHSLSQSDPKKRQLFTSLGCFLENLLIAADYYGFQYSIENLFLEQTGDSPVFKMTFAKTVEIKNDSRNLIFQIPLRHSNRYKYQNEIPNDSVLQKLKALGSDNAEIIFSSQTQKDEVAKIIAKSQIEAMESPSFRKELSHYVKSNFTQHKFGMPGFTLDIPTPVSLFAHKLIKKVNLSKLSKKQDLKLLQSFTPLIGFVCMKEDNKLSWLEAGRVFERLWLLATQNSLTCSVWAAAVQIDGARLELQKKLGTNFKPTVIFRIGYPKTNPKPSPRFSVEDIYKK